ncbi:MAG: FtsQ-type POTRA domain-containing protein [Halieaceae bacterium]|nr:FtsQ-type POTRA domain-containing protein [Halieaceae bacterium]
MRMLSKSFGKDKPKARQRRQGSGATRKVPGKGLRPSFYAWLNRLLVFVGVGVVIAATAQALLHISAIPVARIVVTGELENTRAEALQDLIQPALAGGFLSTDLQHIRSQIKSLPWIFDASVRRRWPNVLEIHVVEQLAIGRWGENGFINHEGQVFYSEKDLNRGTLPRLQGPEGSAKVLMGNYQQLTEELAPLNLVVMQLVVDERGQLEAQLGNGTSLVLGGDEIAERLQRFAVVYRAELERQIGSVSSVDLRYKNGLAVAFHKPSQMAGR